MHEDSEILRLAAAVEKTASHPIARAIINKAEALKLQIPSTQGQLTEPGFGCCSEIEGSLVAVGTLEWVSGHFYDNLIQPNLSDLERQLSHLSDDSTPEANHSKTVVYVGRKGEGVIGAIAVSDILRHDAVSTVSRYYRLFSSISNYLSNGFKSQR